jgi:hypothetical protein
MGGQLMGVTVPNTSTAQELQQQAAMTAMYGQPTTPDPIQPIIPENPVDRFKRDGGTFGDVSIVPEMYTEVTQSPEQNRANKKSLEYINADIPDVDKKRWVSMQQLKASYDIDRLKNAAEFGDMNEKAAAIGRLSKLKRRYDKDFVNRYANNGSKTPSPYDTASQFINDVTVPPFEEAIGTDLFRSLEPKPKKRKKK